MSRGELDDATLKEINNKLPDISELGKRVRSLNPDFLSIAFDPQSTVPAASVRLNDVLLVISEGRHAMHEAFAHLVWYRERSPSRPNELAAIFFGRFYATGGKGYLTPFSQRRHQPNQE